MSAVLVTGADFELGYLASLTRAGIKPVSRWERPLASEARGFLQAGGLCMRPVRRRTAGGGVVEEWLMSRSREALAAYAARFEGEPVAGDPASRRDEGRFFGYPDCCVEAFLSRPYLPNGLARADQQLLFHWACPDCARTRALLPAYREVHTACRQVMWRPGGVPSWAGPRARRRDGAHPGSRRRWSVALIALLGAVPGATLAAGADAHQVPLGAGDTDGDLLLDREEAALSRNAQVADEDGNGVLDGVDLARRLAEALAGLPQEPTDDGSAYVEDFALRGLEFCAVCGESVNMGHFTVHHPRAGLHARVPYIGLHALEHGAASFSGDVHGAGRLEVPLLWRAVHAEGPAHGTGIEDDADSDGLGAFAERHFAADPARADTNLDGVPDGFAVARRLWAAIEGLPTEPDPEGYRLDQPMFGVEACPTCGALVNMGSVEILHPLRQRRFALTYLQLHHLEYGSLTIRGGPGVDPVAVEAVLRPAVVLSRKGDASTLRWFGRSGWTYQLDSARSAVGPWESGPTWQGEGRELIVGDDVLAPGPFFRLTVR